jgi:adenosylcobyric acid synthase
MRAQKITNASTGKLIAGKIFGQRIEKMDLCGYEIHIGETAYLHGAEPFAELHRRANITGEPHLDGCVAEGGRIFGTYLHGIFDDDCFRHFFIDAARAFHRLAPSARLESWKEKRETSLNRLAVTVASCLDVARVFEWAGLKYQIELQKPLEEAVR